MGPIAGGDFFGRWQGAEVLGRLDGTKGGGRLSTMGWLFPALCFVALSAMTACSGSEGETPADPGTTPDAATPPDAGEGEADASGDEAGNDADAPVSCSADRNVEEVAQDAAANIRDEMLAEGYEKVTLYEIGEVRVGAEERERLETQRVDEAVYFSSEAQVLALDEDDRLRKAYEEGDLAPVDWGAEGLVSIFRLDPYTDVSFFIRDAELVVSLTRLEACLATSVPPDPLPRERVTRHVYRVPKLDGIETRTASRWFRVVTFEREPGWDAHPKSPLIERAGAPASVVHTAQGDQMWINGYSAATGFILHGTSNDGVAWDFAWDNAHTCTFEGVDDFDRKRDPTVIRQDDRFIMWVEIEGGAPTVSRIHRTESSDGVHWDTPVRIQGDGMRDFRSPMVMVHEGVLHMWGHDFGERSIVHATSTDGVTWDFAGTVVERGESIDDIDGFGAFTPAAYHDGEKWVLLHAAAYSPREYRDGWNQPVWHQMHLTYATSVDGVEWVKSSTPIWSQNRTEGHWESWNIGRPIPVLYGDALRVYYSGVDHGEPSVGLIVGPGW